MADFGWAFVKGSLITGSAEVSGGVQYNDGGSGFAASQDFTFVSGPTSSLNLTGNLDVVGRVSASTFYGDGSNLTGISSVNIANDGVNRVLTADGDGTMTAESNFTFDGSTLNVTGTLNVSGTINANEININVENRDVINISVTGSTKFGDSSDDTHVFTGSMYVGTSISSSTIYGTVISASTMNLSGIQAGTPPNTSSYLAIDSNYNLVLTSAAGGGGASGVIGAAEDGDYTDGLFTDLTTATPIGTPIDRFNEVLKILAPSPSPSLSRANFNNSAGETVKLSFGVANALDDYSSSNTQAGFAAVNVSGTYQNETSGNNFRLGAYANDTDITGILNFHVVENSQNGYVAYSDDSFGNAETGSLKLEVNGNVIHTLDLDSFTGAGTPTNGTAESLTGDSGFTNISISASSFDGNNSEWYIFKHRTANYKIDVNDMIPGWNYARVIHSLGATDYTTNYVEWINDPSGAVNDLSATNARIEDISLIGSKYLSGVEYNTDATANYKVEINNMYRNVYPASGTPISFTVSNSTVPADQSVEDIDTSVGEDHTKILGVTASLDCNQSFMFNDTITAAVSATHPFKNTMVRQGNATTATGFLIDNRTLASTNTVENFHDESYRITSGDYDSQANVTSSNALWNSENHMTGGGADGHTDGLIFYNQRLYSPIDGDIPNGGNFSGLANVENGQPDYSAVSGTRTFYRVLSNSYGGDLFNLRINSTKNSTLYNDSTLTNNNARFSIKIPGKTGWLDISQDFVYGESADGDGALIAGASNDVDSGDNTHHITFGTSSVSSNENMVIKIEADASWAGYISQLTFTLPSNQNQGTPGVLSSISGVNQGKTARLSFGSSNTIDGYSNATGSSVGLTNYDTNSIYSYGGSSSGRRGIFIQTPIMSGTLNENALGGSGYSADAFFNGFSGSLVLEVNGVEVHSVVLSNSLGGISNDFNANNSGFNLSPVFYSTLSNIPRYDLPYRTGSYQIGQDDQNDGWNYARVIHRTSGDEDTTYIEWIVDPSGSVEDTSVSNELLGNFNHTDVYYQSGIGYFASSPTASFSYLASNFYKNVYATGSSAINFPTTTNCSVTNVRTSGSGVITTNSSSATSGMPILNNSANCEQTTLQVTGTVLLNSLTSISGGLGQFSTSNVSINSTIRHPFKNDKTTTTVSKNYFMVYSGSLGSTNENTLEYFGMESYRIVSGNYGTQTLATGSASRWDSSTAMNNGGAHDDGMVTANGHLISPKQIGASGDTRGVEDSGVLQAPSGNPDYSTLTNSTRTYYRYFKNNTSNDRSSITITLHGSGSMVEKATPLGANGNFHLEVKVPGDTAWLDAGKSFISNNKDVDGSGALVGGSSPTSISTGGTSFSVTFNGGSQLGTGGGSQAVVLKFSSDEEWIGYLERITVAYS